MLLHWIVESIGAIDACRRCGRGNALTACLLSTRDDGRRSVIESILHSGNVWPTGNYLGGTCCPRDNCYLNAPISPTTIPIRTISPTSLSADTQPSISGLVLVFPEATTISDRRVWNNQNGTSASKLHSGRFMKWRISSANITESVRRLRKQTGRKQFCRRRTLPAYNTNSVRRLGSNKNRQDCLPMRRTLPVNNVENALCLGKNSAEYCLPNLPVFYENP